MFKLTDNSNLINYKMSSKETYIYQRFKKYAHNHIMLLIKNYLQNNK